MKISRSILSVLLTVSSIASASNQHALEKVWGEDKENILEKSLLYLPRLVLYSVDDIVTSRTSHRIVNTVSGAAKLAYDSVKGGYELADGLVNIPATIHDATADVIGLAKNVRFAASPRSSRIQLCSTNLMSNLTHDLTVGHFVMPSFHLGVVIDKDHYETTDQLAGSAELRDQVSKGGMVCHDVAIESDETESIAIERLLCVDQEFSYRYDFVNYNCGGYTKTVMNLAGLGYPQHINWGVGAEFVINSTKDSFKDDMSDTKSICDNHINQVKNLIFKIQANQNIDSEIDYFSQKYRYNKLSFALKLQLEAFHLKNPHLGLGRIIDNHGKVTESEFKVIVNKKGLIKRKYKKLLSNIAKSSDTSLLKSLDISETSSYGQKLLQLASQKKWAK